MICASVNRFLTSNRLFVGLDSGVSCYSNPGRAAQTGSLKFVCHFILALTLRLAAQGSEAA